MAADDPVVLRRFIDVRQAEFALSVLQGSGIEGFINVPFTASVAPHYMLNQGGVALFVREADRDRALEVLDSATMDPEMNLDEDDG